MIKLSASELDFKQWSERRKGAFSALLSLDEFIDSFSEGLASKKVMTSKQQTFVRSLLKWCIDNLDDFIDTGGICPDFDFYIEEGKLRARKGNRKREICLHTEDILAAIRNSSYDFLSNRAELGDNIALLCVGGSRSYGTNVDGSDIDIRGMATKSKMQLFTNSTFESYSDAATDTTIYSFEKLVVLLTANNPNVIEMLGLRPEHYLYVSETGRMLLDRKDIFLSKRIIKPIDGCVNGSLKRISDFRRSIEDGDTWLHRGTLSFQELFPVAYKYQCKLYTQMIRLYAMGCEILDTGEVRTYREHEHDLLMDIRRGKFLGDDGKPTKEYNELFDYYKNSFTESAGRTTLPATPVKKDIDKLMFAVNDYVCSNECNHGYNEPSFTAWRCESAKKEENDR